MMRFTVIDNTGTVSFAGPGHCLKVLVAGCSHGPDSSGALLKRIHAYDSVFVDRVKIELARFDEHVVQEDEASIEHWLVGDRGSQLEAFRVFNQQLRNRSLLPAKLGVVLFNLPEKRIVLIQNAYGEVLRRDRGRFRQNGRPVNRYYHYDLPESWLLLP